MPNVDTSADLGVILAALEKEMELYARTGMHVSVGRVVLWLSDVREAIAKVKEGTWMTYKTPEEVQEEIIEIDENGVVHVPSQCEADRGWAGSTGGAEKPSSNGKTVVP